MCYTDFMVKRKMILYFDVFILALSEFTNEFNIAKMSKYVMCIY